MQRIYITGTALVLTMALSTPVFAQGNPARQRPPRAGDLQGANTFGGMLRGIDLTPEQRQKLEALRAQHRRDAGLGNAEGTLARDSAQLDSVRGRPMAMRARSDSAPRRADGMRALPDSARQRPAGARARGDS